MSQAACGKEQPAKRVWINDEAALDIGYQTEEFVRVTSTLQYLAGLKLLMNGYSLNPAPHTSDLGHAAGPAGRDVHARLGARITHVDAARGISTSRAASKSEGRMAISGRRGGRPGTRA